MGLRAVAVAAAILVLVVVGDGILNREWLFGHSSDDEQQYAIQGQVIDPGLVEDGNASGEDAAGVLTTTDWDAAVGFPRYGTHGSDSVAGGMGASSNTMRPVSTMN